MHAFLFMFLLMTQAAFAGLDRLSIQGLNLDYKKPEGIGDFEKVSFAFSSKNHSAAGPYPVEIHRKEKSFVLNSPFADLEWLEPFSFVHNIDEVAVKKGNLSIGKLQHSLTLESLKYAPNGMSAFTLNTLALLCKGTSTDLKIENRLMDDCRESLHLTVDKLDVPVGFFMVDLLKDLPEQEPLKEAERPLDSLVLTSNNGDFALQVYTRLVFYAGLRAWGNVSYENDRKLVVIKIDQIKFGYLPITSIVMKELKKRIKDPHVSISGNTIRITI